MATRKTRALSWYVSRLRSLCRFFGFSVLIYFTCPCPAKTVGTRLLSAGTNMLTGSLNPKVLPGIALHLDQLLHATVE